MMLLDRFGTFAFLLPLLFLPSPAPAEEASISITAPGELVRLAPDKQHTFSVPRGDLEPEQVVVLCWRARIDADNQRGGREFMRVELNGKAVGAMRDRLNPRLINKSPTFRDYRNREHVWYVGGAEGWLTPFSPDFSAPGVKTWFHKLGPSAYAYEVDVTDLMRQREENLLTFQNLTKERYVSKYRDRGFLKSGGDLLLADVRIEMRKSTGKAPVAQNLRAAGEPWGFRVANNGEIILSRGHSEVRFGSAFAQGDGGWVTLDQQSPDKELIQVSSNQWKITIETPLYRVDRTIERQEKCIRIRDHFHGNGLRDPAAVLPRYEVKVPGGRFGTVWIGGDDDPGINDQTCPYNPTLYIPLAGGGLGVVVEDDIMRLQGKFSYDALQGRAEIRSDELVVSSKGGAEYTAELSLYPLNHDSYWDFINLVRQDWQIRTPMPGTIWFTYPEEILGMPTYDLARFLEGNNVAYVIFWEGPSPRHHRLQMPYVIRGPAQLKEEARSVREMYEENQKKAIHRIHGVSRSVKVLLYFHSHTITVFEEGQIAEGQDSLITTSSGRPIRRHRNDERFYPLFFVFPTEKNHYGKELDRLVDHLFGMGADGLYWDEMPGTGRDMKYTYSEFDGYTADLDRHTQKVIRTKGIVAYLSAEYKINLIHRLLSRGKVVHTNGAPVLRSLRSLPITSMVETKTSAVRARELHLTTPYAYTWGAPTTSDFRERLAKGGLCFRPGDASEFVARSFPLTPEFIGEGYIVGENRIITAVDGHFGWDSRWQGIVTVYDPSGAVQERKSIEGDGEQQIRVPRDALIVIEKDPEAGQSE